jgi:hypothetical protein
VPKLLDTIEKLDFRHFCSRAPSDFGSSLKLAPDRHSGFLARIRRWLRAI